MKKPKIILTTTNLTLFWTKWSTTKHPSSGDNIQFFSGAPQSTNSPVQDCRLEKMTIKLLLQAMDLSSMTKLREYDYPTNSLHFIKKIMFNLKPIGINIFPTSKTLTSITTMKSEIMMKKENKGWDWCRKSKFPFQLSSPISSMTMIQFGTEIEFDVLELHRKTLPRKSNQVPLLLQPQEKLKEECHQALFHSHNLSSQVDLLPRTNLDR